MKEEEKYRQDHDVLFYFDENKIRKNQKVLEIVILFF